MSETPNSNTQGPKQPIAAKAAKAPELIPAGGKPTGRRGQVGIYLGKLFRIFIYEKDWKFIPVAALIAFIVAAVVGRNLFRSMEGTTIGSLALVSVCIWNGFFNSIQSVCRERAIIKREHRSGLHISAYMGSHMIYQAFICASQVVVSMIVYKAMGVRYPAQGLITPWFLSDFFLTLFLITYTSDMMALMVSCIVKDTTSAMTAMPFLLIIMLVFSGVAFPLKGAPSRIANFTISKWGIFAVCTLGNFNSLPSTALMSVIRKLGGVPLVGDVVAVITSPEYAYRFEMWAAGMVQKPEYAFTAANLWKDWGILIAIALLCAAVGTLILENIDRDKR